METTADFLARVRTRKRPDRPDNYQKLSPRVLASLQRSQTIDLGLTVPRDMVEKIVRVGREYDVGDGGHFDAPGGTVNIWCGPDDRPQFSFPVPEMFRGAFKEPRDYAGALDWTWNDAGTEAALSLTADPIDLRQKHVLTEEDWEALFAWLNDKAWFLIRLAGIHSTYVGTRCPFCQWMLPRDRLLNDLFGHIAEAHPGVVMHKVVLGDPAYLHTNRGEFALASVEE